MNSANACSSFGAPATQPDPRTVRVLRCLVAGLGLLALLAATGCGPSEDDTTAPGNVAFFRATAGSGKIALTWTNPGDADLAGVVIVRRTDRYPDSSTDGTEVYRALGTSYDDSGVSAFTSYYYAAFSYDEVPNYSSGARPGTAVSSAPVLISDITFSDSALKQCITERANTKLVAELTYLECNGVGSISSLSGIENLTALQQLGVSNGALTSIDEVAQLTNLRAFDMRINSVSDLTPLSSLSQLEYLDASLNAVVDVTPLESLTTLTSLRLDINSIVDVTALAALTKLQSFSATFQIDASFAPTLTTGVAELVTLVNATSIGLSSNPAMPCADLQTLIDTHNTTSFVVSPSSTAPGTNCTP